MATDLVSGLMAFKRQQEAAMRRGSRRAGLAMLRDCINEVPLDEATLRGSGCVIVDNEVVATGADMGFSGGNPATESGEAVREGQIAIMVGFNEPYAAYQNEGMRKDGSYKVVNYSEPDTGPKFIEKRLADSAQYLGVVAAEMGGGGKPSPGA